MTRNDNNVLPIRQGRTNFFWWRMEESDSTVPDLLTDGYTYGRLTIRDAYASEGGEVLLDLDTDNGGVVIDRQQDSDGQWQNGYYFITATDAAALTPWGEAVFDFYIQNGTVKYPLGGGIAVLIPNVAD